MCAEHSHTVASHQAASLNYFICTLDQAATYNSRFPHAFRTVNEFLDLQARLYPRRPAIGFPVPQNAKGGWRYELFSFSDLLKGSLAILKELSSILSIENKSQQRCVALLCPSSIDFLFTWLGLMRAGFSVLLIAPQCQPAAISHLCVSCGAHLLIYDHQYADLASATVSESRGALSIAELPWQMLGKDLMCMIKSPQIADRAQQIDDVTEVDIAYIHHTSGTSGGLPKPIPQTHRAAVGVLPCLDENDFATFTTTPLYHGGIADCFRAWTSHALIWLFPGADLPITTKNIVSSLLIAREAHVQDPYISEVKYFSSVPYVLQMLAEDSTGVDLLLAMKLVGVGGAALPQSIGDILVTKGVNLVSRFGSAECGFLLSSHRRYESDKAWQYLRVPFNSEVLRFEAQTDGSGLFELIVLEGWPHMAKKNRADGSYATSDLFEPHNTLEAAWRYHSRSDSQITLVTGKKFDPAPLEDTIASSSAFVREVLVFGTGRQFPGALIFLSQQGDTVEETEVEAEVWEVVDTLNKKGQTHTRILRNMLVLEKSDLATLEKSSKGSVLRSAMEKKFAEEIENAYLTIDSNATSFNGIIDIQDVKKFIREIFQEVMSNDLSDDADFYNNGCDSAKSTRIRTLLQQSMGNDNTQLPWNIVYDCGNINRLSDYLIHVRSGRDTEQTDQAEEMLALVEHFSSFTDRTSKANTIEGFKKHGSQVVLLTGATGALGAHILHLLRSDFSITRIICLVRANNKREAFERVSSSLVKRRKLALGATEERILCFNAELSAPHFGLSSEELTYLHDNLTVIIHAAWAVNFSLPLRSFVSSHIVGLRNLINLALSCKNFVSFSFCSSTASVVGSSRVTPVPELISIMPSDADPLGYSRSKWVAEAICARAFTEESNVRFQILRIGQLTGDTENGIWNMSEAWPLMLSTVDVLKCLPRVRQPLSWLPLDIAARAVVEITLSQLSERLSEEDKNQPKSRTSCPVYHLVNNDQSLNWDDLLYWLSLARGSQEPFEIVEPQLWLEKLEALESNSAKNLLGLWQKAYGQEVRSQKIDSVLNSPIFSTQRAEKASNAMCNVNQVDEALFRKIWGWIKVEIRSEK